MDRQTWVMVGSMLGSLALSVPRLEPPTSTGQWGGMPSHAPSLPQPWIATTPTDSLPAIARRGIPGRREGAGTRLQPSPSQGIPFESPS